MQPTLIASIAEQWSAHPDRLALRFEDETLSYGQLAQRCAQLAGLLQANDVGRGDVVGIALERSLDLIPTIVAVMAIGAVYMPIDLDYPKDRLAMMFEDAAPKLVVATADNVDKLPATVGNVVSPQSTNQSTHASGPPLSPLPLDPLEPAYLIFTSGSTGRPKGVLNSHGGILNRLQWMQEQFELTAADRVLQKTPIGFDVSVWELVWPLMYGATIVVARPAAHRDAALLAHTIERAGITFIHFVPSMLALFLDQPGLTERCATLRTVTTSGEALSIELTRRCQQTLSAELHNLYGPTEAAIDVTHWHCREDNFREFMPIGYPISGCRMYVLDDALQPLPDGEMGELFIGGIQVALGYIGRPELTKERFLPDPFAGSGQTMYRTGDLGRIHADGAIEFLGRVDDQIKLHGNRIELAEIVFALENLPAVKQAAVITTPTEPVELAAYLIPDGELPGPQELRDVLEKTLPEYMLPRYFVALDAFPTTPNGKLDRKALPPAIDGRAPEGAKPRDELERFLATCWEQLLQLREIPRDIGFFDLGGNSINAARFINRMQKELDAFVYVVSVFEHPTVADYAAFLRKDYADALAKRFGAAVQGAPQIAAQTTATTTQAAITEAQLHQFQSCVPQTLAEGTPEGRPNRSMIFILSPPRSGTTLMRVMLAGHPALFSATELQLLNFQTLQQRESAYQGKFALWKEGLLRCLTEIRQLNPDQAKALVEDMAGNDVTTKQAYARLQEWIAPKLLVDKSPSYALDPAALKKAEQDFSDATYIHLVRHPAAMVDSFIDYHMDQVLYLHPHTFNSAQLGELVWTASHRHILSFLEGIPAARQCRVKFEDLVTDPTEQMRTVLSTIGVDFNAAVIDPYRDVSNKMVDGLHADSTPMGDTHFLAHGAIDASMADRYKQTRNTFELGQPTRELASGFGYSFTEAAAPTRSRGTRRVRKRRRSKD